MKLSKKDLKKISEYIWELPKEFRKEMRVPVILYASEKLLEKVFQDESLWQASNVATLPGIKKASFVMPDAHEGYGFCIGGVAGFDPDYGIISPGGVGFDINCGVRLALSDLSREDIKDKIENLSIILNQNIPSGVGKGGDIRLSEKELDKVLNYGLYWAKERGYADEEDISCCEENGYLRYADASKVSSKAKRRGSDQLGTVGSGNHFVEIQYVAEIFNEEIAQKFGILKNQICVMIHSGSRGLGHQVCTDWVRVLLNASYRYNIKLFDKQLACAPFRSKEGQGYFKAMCCAANYAWCNRQIILWRVRRVWEKFFGESHKLKLLYDVAHNIAKIEKYPKLRIKSESTNNPNGKIVEKELSYKIVGILFRVQQELGRFEREKVYCDLIEKKLKESNLSYKREIQIPIEGSTFEKVDFIIENKVILEVKAKPYLTPEDFSQVRRYLEICNLELGILVNFRERYLKPKRVLNPSFKKEASDYSVYSDKFVDSDILIVHRKGATRAFPKGHEDLPEKYKGIGQPVIIPGSMGTASYVLVGGEKSLELSWGSTCHGAGRTMSRKEATRRVSGFKVKAELEKKGIIVQCVSARGIAEEAPFAYKDVDEVVDVVDKVGLAYKVAKLKPLAVIKGE